MINESPQSVSTKIIGFDTAWTNNPKKPGAICWISISAQGQASFRSPDLATFEKALALISAEQKDCDLSIVAIDQPTVVPNFEGMRPVGKVAASLISFIGGGVQPANRSKIGMFDDNAPIWRFKDQLGATEDPEVSRLASSGHFIMEVFPALALPALEPSFHAHLGGPKYNPANPKFSFEDWSLVLQTVGAYGKQHKIVGLVEWVEEMMSTPKPQKGDQDKLDAVICSVVGHLWRIGPRTASIMIGDTKSGYMIAPASVETRHRLSAKALELGVSVDEFDVSEHAATVSAPTAQTLEAASQPNSLHKTQSRQYVQLHDFIQKRMRMSHIYQPVMLMELFRKGGEASVIDIAKSLLAHDQSQIEYYEQITKNMVGDVLTAKNGITEKIKDGHRVTGFRIPEFGALSDTEIADLVALCTDKIDVYIAARGDRIWSHRKKSAGYISGSLQYEVLKRSKFRCELCGISADDKALEVDHIVARNHGGSDDISNLQALCYSCNAMKRDRDDSDFRGIVDKYEHRQEGCVFCEMPDPRVIASNELCFAIRDQYPVTEHHTLIIPRRHVADFFDLYQPERNAIQSMLEQIKSQIERLDASVTGFNIGVNAGEDAGQTILHCHVHLIPRRKGDLENPRGGVRGVIPDKRIY